MVTEGDFKVPAKSWSEIGVVADKVRTSLGLEATPRFPIIEVIEMLSDRLELVQFEVWTKAEMGDAEGYTCPQGDFIRLREDVYEKACNGDGRARFTAAHELGHFLLHTNIPLARTRRGDGTAPFRLAEPQANQFAAEILMPREYVRGVTSPQTLVDLNQVSWEAAMNRIRYAMKQGDAF
ncbi:ImmA/IrrE family metallo-endopeptidase [Roseibium sp.]|uniref:ImmA/IrrE family metallo-endopeptidase n=1 Tax=Roseibium sp. TaxID=1936156 RepID=UPI003514B6C4